jgi:hypothetical protein
MAKIEMEVRGGQLGLTGTASDGAAVFVPVDFHIWEPVGLTSEGMVHDMDVFSTRMRYALAEAIAMLTAADASP